MGEKQDTQNSLELVEMNVEDVKFLKDYYPRQEFDNETVNRYRMNIGDLPPIIVTKDKILVDGYHRLLAYKVERLEKIKVEVLDIPANRVLWEATRLNAKHGFQLCIEDKKRLARLFKQNNHCSLNEIAEVLAVAESTLSNWLHELIIQEKDQQKQEIIRLYLQCLTQDEITSKTRLTQGRISQIINKFISEEINKISLVPDSLQFFNDWRFQGRDPRFGLEGAAGQIPGQIIENVLHYWTEPFDTVVDPMAGGGTTIDVCKSMYRRYRAYDINPLRDDINKWDITQGFPNETRNCDLIFLDPPYYKKIESKLTEEAVTCLNRVEFMGFVTKLARDCYKTVKKNGIAALLMSDFIDYEKYEESVFAFEYATRFEDAGFRTINHISVPLTTQQRTGFQVEWAKDKKILLEIARDLFMFRKAGGGT